MGPSFCLAEGSKIWGETWGKVLLFSMGTALFSFLLFFFSRCPEFNYVVLSLEFQNLFVKFHKKSGWKLNWDFYQLWVIGTTDT